MNDERFESLERELAGLRPASVPPAVMQGIEARLGDAPLTWGDRLLAGFVGSGALAAAVIVAIVVLSAATAPPPSPQPDRAEMALRQQMMRECQSLLAQR